MPRLPNVVNCAARAGRVASGAWVRRRRSRTYAGPYAPSLAGLDPGALVLAACSGGADSTALAAALAFEAPRAGLRAGAVTVDHGLQAGSADRAATVAAALRELGLDPVEVVPVAVGDDGGPEAAARTARYAALDEAAERLGAAAVLLGHTLDDQAETVLLGLARGSGARSLAGMAPARGRYRRPLLGLRRTTVRAAADGLPHLGGPAQRRPRPSPAPGSAARRFPRWRAPSARASPRRSRAPHRSCAPTRTPSTRWRPRRTTRSAEPARDSTAHGSTSRGWRPCLPAVRTRVLRRAAVAAGCPATDLSAAHVGELDRLVTDWRGQGPLHLPGGVRASRDYGTLAMTMDRPAD